MADWNAALYARFEDQRTRPARDLLAGVGLQAPGTIVDLGCGPGNSTELLMARYSGAKTVGLDSSDDMLAHARRRLPSCDFVKADIASWQPEQAPDLLYANASLQWVGRHEVLFERLFALLAPGGVLAVQMPDNREEPSHRSMREVAAQAPWSRIIGEAAGSRIRILPLETYYDMMTRLGARVEVWRTTYQHPMDSAAAIVAWVSGTGLRPFVDPLPDDMRASFLADYEARIDAAYPVRADGKRLLAFPRLFIVATKPADS